MSNKAAQQMKAFQRKNNIQLGLHLPNKMFTGIFCVVLCLHVQGTVILQENMTQQFEAFTTWLTYFWMEQEGKHIYHQMIPFLSSCTPLQMLFLMSGSEDIQLVRCAMDGDGRNVCLCSHKMWGASSGTAKCLQAQERRLEF